MLHTEDTCPKTGLPVLDVLRSKHSKARPPSVHSLEAYGGKPPTVVPVDITYATVAIVSRRLSGSVGQGGGRGGRLHQPAALAAAVWGSESWTTEYCWGFGIFGSQRSPTLGGLQGTDFGAPHWPRQVPLGTARRCGGYLTEDAGELCVGGDG